MRLQKNTRFAIYSMLAFAQEPGRPISAAEIAERHGISAHHLAKVLRDLGRAGLVESVRGAGGGYRFAANAKRLTLLDVIELFESVSGEADASDDEEPTAAARALAGVLNEIDEISRATFRSITVATMLKLVAKNVAAPKARRTHTGRR